MTVRTFLTWYKTRTEIHPDPEQTDWNANMGHFLMESFIRLPEISAIPIDQNADISIRDQSHRSHALFRRALSDTRVSKYKEHIRAEQGSVL